MKPAEGSTPSQDGLGRLGGWAAETVLMAAVPFLLVLYFAFNEGGYFAAAVGLVAVELCLLIVLRFAASRAPWQGISLPLLAAAAALALFAAWTLASQSWSNAPFRAIVEYDRVLLYLLVLLFFGSFSFSARRTRWILYGVASAIVVVCGAALVARTLPDLIPHVAPIHPGRLSYPLTYWNSLGLFAALGIVLCGHLACSTRDPRPARVLGAASIPLLASVLYYTFSRGGTWVALGGVALYVVVGRPRALISAAIATAPAALIALMTVNPASVLTDNPLGADAIAAGNRIALTVALCAVGAGVLRAVLLPLDAWLDRFRLPTRVRRPAMAFGTAAVLALVLAGCATFQVPSFVADKHAEFTSDDDKGVAGGGSSRLLDARNNGRRDHWDIAIAAYRADPGRGTGAGTWALEWSQERKSGALAKDAHSLYYEVLGELGLPGMIALGLALLLILGAFAWRARGPDRALFAALLAAGLAWAVHAGIDWDWEMPVVTLWLFALGGAALARTPRALGSPPLWTIGIRVAVVAACAAVAVLPAKVALSETHFRDSVEALTVQDCRTALHDARDALSLVGDRAGPYQAIAYCKRLRGDWDGSMRAMSKAVDQDGRNWELWRGLAIARASAGRDPRRQASRALRLNPRDTLARDVAIRFAVRGRRAWIRRGRAATIAPPAIGAH